MSREGEQGEFYSPFIFQNFDFPLTPPTQPISLIAPMSLIYLINPITLIFFILPLPAQPSPLSTTSPFLPSNPLPFSGTAPCALEETLLEDPLLSPSPFLL